MAITKVLVWPVRPLFQLLDRLSDQPVVGQRSSPRSLLYGAFFFSILLAIVVVALGTVLLINSHRITVGTNRLLRDSISVLLIALPGLFLLIACFVALCHDPIVESNEAPPPL